MHPEPRRMEKLNECSCGSEKRAKMLEKNSNSIQSCRRCKSPQRTEQPSAAPRHGGCAGILTRN